MLDSYIGIVTPDGLETLVPETARNARFLQQRVLERTASPAVCFWAVLRQDHAACVNWELEQADADAALRLLQQTAISLGDVIP